MTSTPVRESTLQGSFLQVKDGRSVAIYLREGVAWVAEFSGSRGRLLSISEWHCFHARRVAHAQRRGEVEIFCPIPGDVVARIEGLHQRLGELDDHPLKRKAGLFAGIARIALRLARMWPDPATIGSRLLGAGAFRVD
jgi:hypothetical protein